MSGGRSKLVMSCYYSAVIPDQLFDVQLRSWGPSSARRGGLGGSEEAVVYIAQEVAQTNDSLVD